MSTRNTVNSMTTDKRQICHPNALQDIQYDQKKGFHYIDLKNFTKNIISKPGRSKLFGNLAHL